MNSHDEQAPEFRDEPGTRLSHLVALFLVVVLVLWMGSGMIGGGSEAQEETAAEKRQSQVLSVEVTESTASDVTEYVTAEGQAYPDRQTPIRAEAGGTVAEILVRKGLPVEMDELIARIAPAERSAQLEQARVEVERTQRDFNNAQTLLNRGVATRDRLEDARSALRQAEANLAAVQETLDGTNIRAPIAGLLDQLDIDPGEVISQGAEIGQIIDTDPLTVEFEIPQQQVGRIARGDTAEVRFITGESREGVITYISASADSETRTFTAEVEIANPEETIPAGISATVRVPTETRRAHFVSPAFLSLGADGQLGVKTLVEGNLVSFVPVEIVRAETDGLWVRGLEDDVTIISVGQAFVSDGEEVEPITRSDDSAAAEEEAAGSASADLDALSQPDSEEGSLQ
ncbi:efflux RND transporter periplasmic adaptor subunit [Paracoccaceae bacterium GXU_MW_L88]